MADSITTREAAESAGWRIVHEGMNPEDETSTGNAEMWRAEKYLNEQGRAGRFVEAHGVSEEKLYEAIDFREKQFSVNDEGTVFLPKPDVTPDTSDDSTFERIPDEEYDGVAQNDTLTVLSDPADPESDPEQKVIRSGLVIDPEDAETTHEALAETVTPGSTQSETDARTADAAAIAKAKELRDGASSADQADGTDASAAVAQARHDALTGDEGNSGNDTVVQPAAGAATDASDSEQQGAVPDAEAASSDAVSTNADDNLATAGQSQPVVTGPDTDAEAPAGAPNAQPNESNTTDTVETPPSQQ